MGSRNVDEETCLDKLINQVNDITIAVTSLCCGSYFQDVQGMGGTSKLASRGRQVDMEKIKVDVME